LIQDAKNLDPYLKQHHKDKLSNEHGLTLETIKNNNLYTADAVELNKILKRNDIQTDGIVIPYDDYFSRVRLSEPILINDKHIFPLLVQKINYMCTIFHQKFYKIIVPNCCLLKANLKP